MSIFNSSHSFCVPVVFGCRAFLFVPLMIVGMVASTFVVAQDGGNEPLPVLPGLTGKGIYGKAGRGGHIITVTSLQDSGLGTLRDALSMADKPCVIVFEVGGVIDLKGHDLIIESPNVTIAGQTAPAPGITLIRGGVSINADDVLIQHIAIRPGDKGPQKGEESKKLDMNALLEGDVDMAGGGDESLGIGTQQSSAEDKSGKESVLRTSAITVRGKNVVIAHCSLSWSPNFLANVAGSPGTTFHRCIFAESLVLAKVPNKQVWGAGEAWAVFVYHSKVAFVDCLWTNTGGRHPLIRKASMLMANNYMYNPVATPISIDGGGDILIKNCIMQAGPTTHEKAHLLNVHSQNVYLDRTKAFAVDGTPLSIFQGEHVRVNKTFPPEEDHMPQHMPELDDLRAYLLKHAGARPANRDASDRHILARMEKGKGGLINSQKEVGGYPEYEKTQHKLSLPENPSGDDDGDGYTNLEEWLHELSNAVEAKSDG